MEINLNFQKLQSSSSSIVSYGDYLFAISIDIYYELSEYPYSFIKRI